MFQTCSVDVAGPDAVQGEPFKETKKRLSEFTKIKGKPFDKIKFATISKPTYSRAEYLDDGMISLCPVSPHLTLQLTDVA
jgi:ubiquitin carboxyl-terminal hydrolase 7